MSLKGYFSSIVFLLCLLPHTAFSWTSIPTQDDPLIRMPGTQPEQGVTLQGPDSCMLCHANYDQAVEPGFNWKGSMMAQAARDPIFWACMAVAAQDSVWALGTPNAVDLCERCHFPEGWLAGRSDPPNASAMTGTDYDGVSCDVCHTMWDPFFEETHNGTREGNDWQGYWDEASELSQSEALITYTEDMALASVIATFSGNDFFANNFPQYAPYRENASGQYFMSGDGAKRAGFADHEALHDVFYSRYHKSKYMCAACHDVSNPVLANMGNSGLPDLSGEEDLITEQYSASRYFHIERTFSEFMLSAFGRQGGAATNADFQAQGAPDITWAAKCQDCHMRDVVGAASFLGGTPVRPTDSLEHPASGLPLHDMTGGNAWISHILASLDPGGPVYDAVNAQILNQGPETLTLDLTAGQVPSQNGAALKAGSDRAKQQLLLAATIKDLAQVPDTSDITFKVQNNTGHKLTSGFPEGRRMFVNVKAYADEELIHEINPYDMTVGTLKGLPNAASSPQLAAHEAYVDELVYEMHPTSALTGEQETFHFVLATGRYKDNRIPPRGFDIEAAAERLCEPVWHGVVAPDYFSAEEYTGGYDEITVTLPPETDFVDVRLFYQGTSREYVEFLRDEINGTASTLTSPTPSEEAQAYILQTDPFFSKMKAWGNAIWDLWYHNHGLDESGVQVDGIVPFEMASETLDIEFQVLPPVADVSLKGAGTLNVIFGPDGHIEEIELEGTDEKSSLSIKSNQKKSTVYVQDITVNGSLKDIKGKDVILTGQMTATGGINKVQMAGTAAGSLIAAPWLGKVSINDFAGDMTLTGTTVSPKKGLTLSGLSIKGALTGSTLSVSGDVGSVKVGTWGAGSILAVGVDPGGDGLYFTGDDSATGGSLSKISYKSYDTDNGGSIFGIIADEFVKMKTALPFEDGDFYIWQL